MKYNGICKQWYGSASKATNVSVNEVQISERLCGNTMAALYLNAHHKLKSSLQYGTDWGDPHTVKAGKVKRSGKHGTRETANPITPERILAQEVTMYAKGQPQMCSRGWPFSQASSSVLHAGKHHWSTDFPLIQPHFYSLHVLLNWDNIQMRFRVWLANSLGNKSALCFSSRKLNGSKRTDYT